MSDHEEGDDSPNQCPKRNVSFSVEEKESQEAEGGSNMSRRKIQARDSVSEDPFDRALHSLFCQMNVLNDDGSHWKEQARWLVYEEKLEGSDRWSKPHMPTTAFTALEEVRNAVEESTVALQLYTDCGCMRKIVDDLCVVIARHESLDDNTKQMLVDVLRKPHIRGYDTSNALKTNVSLQKKMAKDTEAANILVGRVDFLKKPIIAFARLLQSEKLTELTEVQLPTKFIFLVLSPKDCEQPASYYEEIGRSMAQLLTDKIFTQVAYKAKKRQHLLEGIDEFKSQLTVLPPSIWDPKTRLDPVDEKIEMNKVKQRLQARRWSLSLSIERHASPDGENAQPEQSLERSGRLFGGLIADVRRRFNRKTYLSDIRDGMHLQCLASIIFLYFACVTPIITFGGLLGVATDNYMGTIETLLSGALCGIVYAIFSGQPLTIVGATGPLLVFETLLYTFCKDHGLEFLPFRFWIGAWTMLYLILVVAFDLSAWIRYITRFTEECFATLVSIIFIYASFKKLAKIWRTHPIHSHALDEPDDYTCHCEHPPTNGTDFANGTFFGNTTDEYHTSHHAIFEEHDWGKLVYEDCITYQHRIIVAAQCITEQECVEHGWILVGPACNVHTVTHSIPDVFLLSVLLCFGTYFVAAFFRDLRESNYLTYNVRNTLSDFAIFLGIVICTAIDAVLAVDTPKLLVPDEIKNTRNDRSWLVNPMGVTHWWHCVVAAVPSLLSTILIFLDQQITSVIVNRKQHKLKKGHGYHLDLLVVAFLVFSTSLLGVPWFVAATVAAITHVSSLRKLSDVSAPGEKPVFIGAREQRVTGLVTHILIGVSVFLTGVLKHIPMAVLYGVFLYMGINALRGMQFVDRILLLLSPKKYQADLPFLRHVTTKRVHIFTLLQICCFIVLWIFKSIKAVALLFPLMILLPAVVRTLMERFYTQEELFWLDDILPLRRAKRRDSQTSIDELDDDMLMENGKVLLKGNGSPRSKFSKFISRWKSGSKRSGSDKTVLPRSGDSGVELAPLNVDAGQGDGTTPPRAADPGAS